MDNQQLKNIIKEIQQKEGVGLAEIAAQSGLDRSYLSSFIHSRVNKLVTEKMFGKLAKGYPLYFKPVQQKTTESDARADPATIILPTGDVKRSLADYITMLETLSTAMSSAITNGLVVIKNNLENAETNLSRGQDQLKDQLGAVEDNIVQRLGGLYQALATGEGQAAPGSVKKGSVPSASQRSNDGKSKGQKA